MKAIRVENAATSARLGWRIDAKSDVADIEIYDHIGLDFFGDGLSATDFVRDLRALGSLKQINLHVNSPGGYVDDAKAIYHALQSHPASVTAYVEGVAASAASFIIMAADTIAIAPHARIQIHDAHAGVSINSVVNASDLDALIADLRNMRNLIDEESDDIARIYSERSGGEASEWRKRMQANGSMGTSYRGQDAVDIGLADELAAAPAKNVATAPARNARPLRVAAHADSSPLGDAPPQEPTPNPELFKQFTARGYEPPMPTDISRLIERNLAAAKEATTNG